LIQRLAKSRVGVGLDELAEDLGCVRRTVYRDLDALMYAGFPVVSEKRDQRVFYRFIESFGLGDVPFTGDEVLALLLGGDLLSTLEGTVFHDSMESALSKIRAGMGPELVAYLEKLGESFRVMPGPHKRYADYRETIQTLNDAVLERRRVSMRYRTGRTGAVNDRGLDPYRVWYRSGGLYVVGHDHRSGELRTFAVNRIEQIELTDQHFEVSPDFDFEAFTSTAFGVISEPATRVRIRFAKEWRTHVEEHTWHESQQLQPLPDGGTELVMEAGGTPEIRNWVLSFGAGAEVLEPPGLRDEVAAELAAAARQYQTPGSSQPTGPRASR
jgi:predicted DNA-binding transcriptional regulator YafY